MLLLLLLPPQLQLYYLLLLSTSPSFPYSFVVGWLVVAAASGGKLGKPYPLI